MNTLLIILTLAAYLIKIAATLRHVSQTLGLVTFGVRAIERQTEPLGPVVGDINGALGQIAGALEELGKPSPPPSPPGAVAASSE